MRSIFKLLPAIAISMSLVACAPQPVPSRRVIVTAAHLGAPEGYTSVYVDEETDYAVYVAEDYTAEGIHVGDTLSLSCGTDAVVQSVSDKDFTVTVADISKIVPGVSGSTVYLDSTPIGFVSGWDGDGAVRCIFY